jgi:membrane-bound lytic murein transglycosylase D
MRAAVLRWVALVGGLLIAGHAPSSARAQGSGKAAKRPASAVVAQAKPSKGVSSKKKPAKKPTKATESKKPARRPGSSAAPADTAARTQIAGQAVETPTESPELSQLREVDKVLFWDLGEVTVTPTAPSVSVTGLPPTPAEVSSVEASTSSSSLAWMATLTPPDLPYRWDVRLIRYLDYFKNTPSGKSFVAGLLKRSGRYEAKLREALRASGLPEDLVYLSLVESGMNPRIVSHAGAAGLWQFMPKAGSAYGLRIDKTVDERLDPERSTQAATRFLSDLHKRFGRWELAMAAYNMGHGGLLTSIRKYNTNDFWELAELEAGVPYETALYVPKILAIAFVARNKEAFGLADLTLDPAEKWVDAPAPPKPSSTDRPSPRPAKVGATPPRAEVGDAPSPILGPTARPETPSPPDPPNTRARILRWGESLERVAAEHGTTEAKLRKLNGLVEWTPPRPGTAIRVPDVEAAPKTEQLVAVVPARSSDVAGGERVFYEVVWGDQLDDVARTLGVSSAQLIQWNNLDRSAKLHAKMVLQAFVATIPDERTVRVVRGASARVLVVGSPEFFEHFESKNGRSRFIVTTREGDTFAGLAKRYGLSVGMLERINHRSRTDKLQPGESLVVYGRERPVDRTVTAPIDPTETALDARDTYDDDSPAVAPLMLDVPVRP